jgi:hypothetical protein
VPLRRSGHRQRRIIVAELTSPNPDHGATHS